MSKEYPKKFLLKEMVEENTSIDSSLWESSRGFIPKDPKIYDTCLVIPLYSLEGRFLGNQLRDVNDDVTETKYTLTNNIYDPLVKTDQDELVGIQVICEGTLDCVLLRLNKINAVTTLGLKAFRVKKAFEDLTERAIFIFDNDISGNQFAKRYSNKAMRYSVPMQYKDVCQFFQENKDDFYKWLKRLVLLTSF